MADTTTNRFSLFFLFIYVNSSCTMPQKKGKNVVKFIPTSGPIKEIRVQFDYDPDTQIVGQSHSKAFPTWESIALAVQNNKMELAEPANKKDKVSQDKYKAVRKKLASISFEGPQSQEMKSDEEEEEEEEEQKAPPLQVNETSDTYKDLPDLSDFKVPMAEYILPPNTLPAPGSVFIAPVSDDAEEDDEETLDEKNYNPQLKALDDESKDEDDEKKDDQWEKYTFKDKTIRVWAEWMEIARDKQNTFVDLMEKVNSQMDIIDNEMRRFVATTNRTHGAKSDSFLAALRTHLISHGSAKERTNTDKTADLLEDAINMYWSEINDKSKEVFNQLVETLANCTQHSDRGNGIAFHIKQFKFTQETQLLGDIKRKMLWPLVDQKGKEYTGHEKYEDAKKVYPLNLLQMSEMRHLAQRTLEKNKREWEQSHPLTFVSNKVIAFKNKLVRSNNIHDKILLVILCVGSRWIEVVKMSDFYVAADTDWKDAAEQKESTYFGNDATRDVVVRGIAKARKQTEGLFRYVDQDTVEEKDPEFNFERENRYLPPKPVLFLTVKEIQYLVYTHIRPFIRNYCQTKLKQPVEEVSPKALAQALNRKTNDRLKLYDLTVNHQRDAKRLTTHALRKVYGNYSYQLYAEQARVTKIAWLNKVLGHKPSSFSTALHYNTASVLDAPLKHQDYGDKNVIIADIKQYTEEAKEINDTLRLWREEDVVANVTRIIQNMAGKRPLMIDKRSDAENLGKIPFVTKRRKIIYLDPVQRSGISHSERYQKFRQAQDTFTTHKITHSYDTYNRLGFSSSYIAKQKKQEI